ncbi:PRC-barrel domain-containing protein [Variibacter gotjawalensis]|nr:PRC-barrel domain-containing protein [Variibacter gotjawalensis]NIK49858.1 sporulation protein YlmC with PRC-barrel domain [Variibacter gotjawalensis]
MLATVAIAALVLPTTLMAQTAAPQTTTTTTTTAASSQWRTSKLMGLDVYNEQNEKLGDVSEVLIDPAGKVTGVVIGVGGFLGMGQRDIKVSLDKLKFVNEARTTTQTTGSSSTTAAPATRAVDAKWYPNHAIMAGATNDTVKAMPEFKYD